MRRTSYCEETPKERQEKLTTQNSGPGSSHEMTLFQKRTGSQFPILIVSLFKSCIRSETLKSSKIKTTRGRIEQQHTKN